MARIDDDYWFEVIEDETERTGPAILYLFAQPPKDSLPTQAIGKAEINAALAERIDQGKVGFVRLTAEGETNPAKHGITAQVVRNAYRKSEWYLAIPNAEDAWRVMMSQNDVWWV